MKTLIALLAAALLAGCAGFDAGGNPKPFWIGENICVGSGCPGAPSASELSMFQPWTADEQRGQWARPILPPLILKRED